MKNQFLMMLFAVLLVSSMAAYGQMIKRTDAVWARNMSGSITLDGKLTEPEWAQADSIKIQMGKDSGIPGSGWYWENGVKGLANLADPTDATVKFLVKGDTLYLGIYCKDKSIGGGVFNQFDGFLMNVRYRQADGFQTTPFPQARTNQACELFYGWVTESWADTTTKEVGSLPALLGDFGSAYVHPRPDSLRDIWDAATYVQGTTNDDSTPDTSYSMEIKINLNKFGYDVMQTGGDVVMWSMSIYDADYEWPLDTLKQSGNRVWVQCPWSNASAYNHMRIFVRPDVTTSSGAEPTIGPDYVIPSGQNYAAPVIDGMLTEPVWQDAPSLPMKYGDANIRNAYANTAKYRSGQFQPTVNGATNAVVDPNTVSVKYFYLNDTLFLGFDVKDKFVQSVFDYDRWDGFRVIMEQRDARNGDSVLAKRRFTFRVDTLGHASREEDLSIAGWDSLQQAVTVALALKGGTTVDTMGTQADSGYTAEMKIDLRKMGYPAGRGDGVVFLSVDHFDGDSFEGGSYGTRTWFMREGDFDDGAAWFYMDPSALVTDVAASRNTVPSDFALLGNYPNPFNPSTDVQFQIGKASNVTFDVFDITGRLVHSQSLGVQAPGTHTVKFDARNLASGSYIYRLKNAAGATLVGKMMLLK
jgi:hypothetical protein